MAFWDEKTLAEMTDAEWEALCDGCGRCCLIKLEDEDTGEIMTSDVHCKMLDAETCRCSDYKNRQSHVPDCIKLTADNILSYKWVPSSCAYRRLAEGRGLAWWHPLISGDPTTVAAAGISMKGRVFNETDIAPDDWENHAVDWPDWEPQD